MKSLVPWKRKSDRYTPAGAAEHPLVVLQHQMNRLFDSFFEDDGFDPEDLLPRFGASGSSPRFEVTETEDEIRVKAELPGMDEEDIDVLLDENQLTIRGEKKEEREERDKKRNVVVSEFSYGSFYRTLPLPSEIDRDKVEAKFKKGVLTLKLPRTESAKSNRRRIEIHKE